MKTNLNEAKGSNILKKYPKDSKYFFEVYNDCGYFGVENHKAVDFLIHF